MRTTFAGTRLQALSIIFVRSFSACVVGRKRIRRPPAIRSRPYRRDRGGQPGPGFLRKGSVTARSRRAARKGSAAPLRGSRTALHRPPSPPRDVDRRPSSWRSSVQEPRPTSSGSSMCCTHCPTSDIGSRVGSPCRRPDHEPSAAGRPSSPVRRWCPPGMRSAAYRADTLSAYPPGIPNLMAGEVVTPAAMPNSCRQRSVCLSDMYEVA